MEKQKALSNTFHFILTRMVGTGQAPHYTEIAKELGGFMEEGRKISANYW